MADRPTTTPATPEPVRKLELEAMRLYRAAHPDAPDWQELSDETRLMWVRYAEHPPSGAKVSRVGPDGWARMVENLLEFALSEDDPTEMRKAVQRAYAAVKAARSHGVPEPRHQTNPQQPPMEDDPVG